MKETTKQLLTTMRNRAPELEACEEAIAAAYGLMYDCFAADHKVLTCGNGGSAADAEHIVGELMKGFRLRRPVTSVQRETLKRALPDDHESFARLLQRALPAISLVSQSSLITAFSNDVSAEMVYAQQVFGYGAAGDLLIAISTSGSSKNVVNAVKAASAFGLLSIGLTGEAQGPLSDLCTVTVRAPARETAAIQEYHLMIYHTLCSMIENELFADE